MIRVKDVKTIGKLAREVRKGQSLDQLTAGAIANSGITFVSQFENGKETVRLGKALELLDALGITVYLDLPLLDSELIVTKSKDNPELDKPKSLDK
ncbi:MAG: helix-turn-helix domain-containing protein [Acidiferrobacterales bacterium]|nr:helix-turn-helix domain-containing protein [Acidiferrobacterales bacterium]